MIHYHGTPMGGQREQVARFAVGRHFLVPWGRPEDIRCVAEYGKSFCIDNSAFSAWKSGNPITDWRGYYEFVREWMDHPGFDFWIIPDVIDGTEADNAEMMGEYQSHKKLWGDRFYWVTRRAVPVWHLHESLERLRTLASYHDRVALGSSGKWATPGTADWWDRMAEAMAVVCDDRGRPMCRLHGLRMLSVDIFPKLPLASADSTNVAQNSNLLPRFGQYKPPTQWQRRAVIAERVEQFNSASCWTGVQQPEFAW